MPSLNTPRAPTSFPDISRLLDAPEDVVQRYLQLVAERRRIEGELSWVRGELELAAASGLDESSPRGRFVLPGGGVVAARLMPTCTFDRVEVGRMLQRAGRLADVATISGPQLARFLAKEPVMAARLSGMVRPRRSVMLMATPS